jgi:EmrB/QacA subfamily drug resistance transporter
MISALDASLDEILWVVNAYVLVLAVLLITAGRLGDLRGQRKLFVAGVVLFTLASLACGLAPNPTLLIAFRAVQGIGAALLMPQTMAIIIGTFPADRRGTALGIWGAVAGLATVAGPTLGGVLVTWASWRWIFIVNVPIGIIGIGLAYYLVPALPTEKHSFDVIGVVLSGIGMFLVVFALQEGQSHDWAPWIWAMIVAGAACIAGFIYWQAVNPREPLIPLNIFRDNDFSLSNVGIAVIGFAVTAMVVPVMFYAQAVCGLSPIRAALLMAPMAIATGVLAPFVGKLVDREHPTPIVGGGFALLAIALTWLSIEMTPTTPIWRLVLPFIAMGIGMAFIWSPLAATATRHLPDALAGAGSGVYNATRQVGGVLGSASMAAFMTSRISAEMPGGGQRPAAEGSVTKLPSYLHEPFAAALSQALLLPAFVALFGVVAAMFLRGYGDSASRAQVDDGADDLESFTASLRAPFRAAPARSRVDTLPPDYFPDDDDYVEYTIDWDDPHPPPSRRVVPEPVAAAPPAHVFPADDSDTEVLHVHVEHPLHAPADTWHGGPVETWHSLLDDEQPEAPVEPEAAPWRSMLDDLLDDAPPPQDPEPIGFAHNGFHVDHEQHFQVPPPVPDRSGRHARGSDDDAGTYGKHSMRFRD